MHTVHIGYDRRQPEAFAVARHSLAKHIRQAGPAAGLHIGIAPALDLQELRRAGLYWRPTSVRDGNLWDDISDAPMSTEFSNSRFLVPHLARYDGWALFIDCDMLFRTDPRELFKLADPRYAVMCVQHDYRPDANRKMDGQVQTRYNRKLWSSVMLFNAAHPSNRALDLEMVNTLPGRDLHRFCWLRDDEIGALPAAWNWLPRITEGEPKLVHWTEGGPWLAGFEDEPYSDEWRAERKLWLAGE